LNFSKTKQQMGSDKQPIDYCLALMAARLPVTAWKPVLMVWTEHLEWQVMHCRKNRRVSLFRMVSGDLE
jgi:hypothetical protein